MSGPCRFVALVCAQDLERRPLRAGAREDQLDRASPLVGHEQRIAETQLVDRSSPAWAEDLSGAFERHFAKYRRRDARKRADSALGWVKP